MKKTNIKKIAIATSAVMALSVFTVTGCSEDEPEMTEETTKKTEAPTPTPTEDKTDLDSLFELDDEAFETFDFESFDMPEEITAASLNDPHMKDICQDYLDQGYMLFGGVSEMSPDITEGFMGMSTTADFGMDGLSGDISEMDFSEIDWGTTESCTVMLFNSYDSAMSFVQGELSQEMELTMNETADGVEFTGGIDGIEMIITVYDDGIVNMVEIMDMNALMNSIG